MLVYLDGKRNLASSPNENYARELLELFTLGRGATVKEGDYTNYTEHDIKEIAKILTGWRAPGFQTVYKKYMVGAKYISRHHNKETKRLSHRFDYAEIENHEEKEYEVLIDIIFKKREVALFFC